MPSRTSDDKSNRHCVDFSDPFPSAGTAICTVKFRLFDLRAPEAASLQKIAARANMPVRKAICGQQARPLGRPEPFLTDRWQAKSANLQASLEGLVIDTLVIQQARLCRKLIPRFETSSHHRNRRSVFTTKVNNGPGTIAGENLTSSNFSNRFQRFVSVSRDPPRRTNGVDASTVRSEFGVGFCLLKRALFPHSAAASAEVKSAS